MIDIVQLFCVRFVSDFPVPIFLFFPLYLVIYWCIHFLHHHHQIHAKAETWKLPLWGLRIVHLITTGQSSESGSRIQKWIMCKWTDPYCLGSIRNLFMKREWIEEILFIPVVPNQFNCFIILLKGSNLICKSTHISNWSCNQSWIRTTKWPYECVDVYAENGLKVIWNTYTVLYTNGWYCLSNWVYFKIYEMHFILTSDTV